MGEDVTYSRDEQILFQETGSALETTGDHTIDSFSEIVGAIDLFPGGEPEARLRGASTAAGPSRARRSTSRFVSPGCRSPTRSARAPRAGPLRRSRNVSPSPPSVDPLRRLLEAYPGTRLKLDPTSEWTAALVEELSELDAVDIVDLKAAYRGTAVDQPTDPALYAPRRGGISGRRSSRTRTSTTPRPAPCSSRIGIGSAGTRSSTPSPMSRHCRSPRRR